jgi:hypothetical protein
MRRFIILAALAIAAKAAGAQTAVLPVYACTLPGTQAQVSGLKSTNYQLGVIPSCLVTVYLTGTQTIATTTPQTPLTANTNGSIPPIYAAVNQGYDVVLSGGIPPNTYSSPVTLTGLTPAGGSGTQGCLSGNIIANGCTGATTAATAAANLVTGNPIAPSMVNNIYQVDGTTYASVAAAIAACVASTNTSCTVDARGSGSLGPSADVIGSYSGTKPITLMLGSYTDYKMVQIQLVPNFQFIGEGSAVTQVTSVSTSNQPLFVLPQANSSPAYGVRIQGVKFLPAAGATTQDGMDLECGAYTNSGLWYSTFDDVWFGNNAPGGDFPGNAIRMVCPTPASAIQFSQFRNVVAFRPNGSSNPALYICGSGSGNDQFYGGQFDAESWTDSTAAPNVYIGGCPSTTGDPYSVLFDGTTIQGGKELVNLNGTFYDTFTHMHHEGSNGLTNGYLFTLTAGTANFADVVDGVHFSNIGVGSGGYLFNTVNSGGSTVLTIKNCSSLDSPGSVNSFITSSSATHAESIITDSSSSCGSTANVTNFLQGNTATLSTNNMTNVVVDDSTTITTITSSLPTNQQLCIAAYPTAVTFSNAGNLVLAAGASSYTLALYSTTCFAYNDYLGEWAQIGGDTSGGGSGTVIDGAGTATPGEIAVSTSTPHQIQYATFPVASGTAGQIAYYAADGTAVSGTNTLAIFPNGNLTLDGALPVATSGAYNIAIGQNSLSDNTTGAENTAVGVDSLIYNTTGWGNTAVGDNSLSGGTGSKNAAFGAGALIDITSGFNNAATGYGAGQNITGGVSPNTTSDNSVYDGYAVEAKADGDTNEIVIGASTTGKGSNTATIGNSSVTDNYLSGKIHAASLLLNAGSAAIYRCSGGTSDGLVMVSPSTAATACTSGGGSLVSMGVMTP